MIALVIPEPAPWPSLVSLPSAPRVFAPWAGGRSHPWLPRRLRDFRGRRHEPDAIAIPGWQLAELGLSVWIGGRAHRQLRARFAVRDLVDRMAAAWIRVARPRVVVAPSCGARYSFAAARATGARAVLVEDLPDIRELQQDLDRAAVRHPHCAFLRRFRADGSVMARQEVERALADELWVRGAFARERRLRSGIDAARLRPLASPSGPTLARGHGTILLAGLAAARHGTVEAIAALEQTPRLTLAVRTGPGTEPRHLLRHPRVTEYRGQPVEAVIAPAWCETYPAEVAAAARSHIPVIATARAAGFTNAREVPVGDAAALAAALLRLRSEPGAARAAAPDRHRATR